MADPTNAERPASPFTGMGYEGLTKREYFAGLAMQGLLAADTDAGGYPRLAVVAIYQADALLAELEKTE